MKYFPLVWATLWRRKTRALFTLLSIMIAFLLFGMLETVDYAFSHPSAGTAGADKLITTNKYSITLPLPFADLQEIRSVPGVTDATWLTWLGAYYQEQKNFVFALPIDTASYFNVHKDEFVVSDEHMKDYRGTRSGALVNVALMKKFGWRVGEKLPIHSTIWTQKNGSLDWTLDIVGTFDVKDSTQANAQQFTVFFHYDLFDEGRSFGKGTVGWVEERIQIGDIGFVLRAILGAVFFTLLFLTGNTMMQSVRERIPELAVLKTMGFSNGKVLALVIGESLLLCLFAAVIGLGLSYATLPIIGQALQGVQLDPVALIPGLGAAVLLALIVGLPPALRAMRLNIVDALAGMH